MRRIVLATLLTLALAPLARADFVDFAVGNRTPADPLTSIDYVGGATPLYVSHLPVLNYTGNGTPANDGVIVSTPAAFVCFVTGDFIGTGPGADRWVFDPGGWIAINDGSDNLLLTGTFAGPTEVIPLAGGDFRVIASGFTGSIAPALAAFFGTGTDGPGGLTVLFSAPGSIAGQLFSTSTLHSGNVAIDTTVVPTPNAAILTGIGTVCITAFRLRRRRR